jgi:sugar/nucleoside kinase (ribokinase family)
MRAQQYSVTVLGDIFVEVSSRIRGMSFENLQRDRLCYDAIHIDAGGTAMNFALAAAGHFGRVNLLGRVGNDAFGESILKLDFASNIRSLIEKSNGVNTGTTIYIRDSSDAVRRGTRLLVVDRGANRCVDTEYVNQHSTVISGASLFFVDGYSFLDEPRRSAAEAAMQIAKAGGAAVALDLVPHDAHLFFSSADVARWVKGADLLIAEVRTIRQVLGLKTEDEVHDFTLVRDTLGTLRECFPETSFHLRFGVGNIENSLLYQMGQAPVFRTTGYSAAKETRGFGDRLSASDLADYVVRKEASRSVHVNNGGERPVE